MMLPQPASVKVATVASIESLLWLIVEKEEVWTQYTGAQIQPAYVALRSLPEYFKGLNPGFLTDLSRRDH